MSRFEGPTEVEEPVNRFNEPTYVKSDKESKAATRRVAQGQGLGEYLEAPDDFPKTRVIYWNDDFVVINDSEFTRRSDVPRRRGSSCCVLLSDID